MTFDIIVIGRGLIGSAAAKYLSKSQKNVALIGPDEAKVVKEGTVFASHYDQARVQRIIGKDAVWTLLNQQSAAQYEAMEKETNIQFHSDVGCLYVNPYGSDPYLDNMQEQAKFFNTDYQEFSSGESLNNSFPDFHFPAPAKGIFEASPSGHINPRLLIEAQLKIIQKNGGKIFNDTVNGVSNENGIIKITTIDGKIFESKKVLLAPGAFVNFLNLLQNKLVLKLKSESTIWVKVSPEDAHRLNKLPSLLYEISEPEIQDIYLVRPLLFPDGAYYLKLGGNFPNDIIFKDLSEIRHWFKNGKSQGNLEVMQNALKKIMPALSIENSEIKNCIITYTQHGKPYIGRADMKNLFVATGGNGYSAMCSDALGKIAANLLLYGKFPEGFSEEDFKPVFA